MRHVRCFRIVLLANHWRVKLVMEPNGYGSGVAALLRLYLICIVVSTRSTIDNMVTKVVPAFSNDLFVQSVCVLLRSMALQ